jgi:hypothetical protein
VAAIVFAQAHAVRAAGSAAAPLPAEPADLRAMSALPDPATERRLNELEIQVHDLSRAPRTDDAGTPAQPPPVEDRRASAERARHDFEARLLEHRLSPRDSGWATSKERALTEGIGDQANAHTTFSLVDVDCRTTTCVARLQWPSEQEARAQIRDLVQNTDIDCARQVTLPPPGSNAAYEVSVLFDCAPPNE